MATALAAAQRRQEQDDLELERLTTFGAIAAAFAPTKVYETHQTANTCLKSAAIASGATAGVVLADQRKSKKVSVLFSLLGGTIALIATDKMAKIGQNHGLTETESNLLASTVTVLTSLLATRSFKPFLGALAGTFYGPLKAPKRDIFARNKS